MQFATVPPSLQPSRGARALEMGTLRIDALLSRLAQAEPARVSLDVSNIGAMFQQGLTIATYHLPSSPVRGAVAQALAGMDLVTRRFHAGDPVATDQVRAQLFAWRATAIEAIAALRAVDAPNPRVSGGPDVQW